MGLFCRGLHCAGCGKGIPLGIVVALCIAGMAIGTSGNDSALAKDIANDIIAIAICMAIAAIGTAFAVAYAWKAHSAPGIRWEGPTMAETKARLENDYTVPQWPHTAPIQREYLTRKTNEYVDG